MNSIITFNDCDYYEGFFYAASDIDNSFIRFNRDKSEILFTFDNEKSTNCLFMQSTMVDDRIILTPSNAGSIYIYDCSNEKLTQISLKDAQPIKSKFHGVITYGKNAFFMPVAYPKIVRMDLDNYDIEYINVDYELPADLSYAMKRDGFLISHKLYSKSFFEMDLVEKQVVLKEKNIPCSNVWGYCICQGYEYFITDKGIQITKENKLVYKDEKWELNDGRYLFTPYNYDDKVFFFPFSTGGHTNAIPIVIEKKANDDFVTKGMNRGLSASFHCVKECARNLYMIRDSDSSVMMFDPKQEAFDVYIKGRLKGLEQERKSFGIEEWVDLQLG